MTTPGLRALQEPGPQGAAEKLPTDALKWLTVVGRERENTERERENTGLGGKALNSSYACSLHLSLEKKEKEKESDSVCCHQKGRLCSPDVSP